MICIRQVEFNPCAAMTIDDLKNVRLSEASRRYLGIYLKLSDLYGEVTDITGLIYHPESVDRINEGFTEALSKLHNEAMKLFVISVEEHINDLGNHTEL